MADLGGIGKRLLDGLALALGVEADLEIVAGMVVNGSRSSGLAAAAERCTHRTVPEVAEVGDFDQGQGAARFESGQRVGQKLSFSFTGISHISGATVMFRSTHER